MARDALESLFFGELCPWERMPGDDEVKNLQHQMSEKWKELDGRLDEESRHILEEYYALKASFEFQMYAFHFKQGFYLGAEIAEKVINAS